MGDVEIGRAGRHDRDVSGDRRIGLPDPQDERPGAHVVVGAPGERLAREVVPGLGREARHQDVVLAGELPRDRGDLRDLFPRGEDDLGKTEPADTVEIQSEVGSWH